MHCVNEKQIQKRELWHSEFDDSDPRATLCTESHADLRTTDNQLPRFRQSPIKSAGLKYLSAIIGDLEELMTGPLNDEVGRLRPTTIAYDTAVTILADAGICAFLNRGAGIPSAHVSTDPDGGIRVEWLRGKAKVFLVVSSDASRNYVYKELNRKYETLEATGDDLAIALSVID